MQSKIGMSLTQQGNLTALVGVLMIILNYFHINIGSDELTAFIAAAISLVGIVISWWGRYRHGDLTLGGFYKQ